MPALSHRRSKQIYLSVRNLILQNLNLDYLFEIFFFENNPLYGIMIINDAATYVHIVIYSIVCIRIIHAKVLFIQSI